MKKIIFAVAVVIALIGAWFLGDTGQVNPPVIAQEISMQEPQVTDIEIQEVVETPEITEAPEVQEISEVQEIPEELETTSEAGLPAVTTIPPTTTAITTVPAVVEPEALPELVQDDGSFTVTLSINVERILHNMHLLHSDKHELVPADGWILRPVQVTAYPGESVFDVLQRETRERRIHMVSRFTPMFNSAYIEAINNLFEFDVGHLSGWMYSVNGDFKGFGSTLAILNPNDVIEWHYTVELGRDLGVFYGV